MTALPVPPLVAIVTLSAASILLAGMPRLLSQLGTYDLPSARSSHDRPVLRGAGLGTAGAMVVGFALSAVEYRGAGRAVVLTLLLVVLAVAAVGFTEDRWGLTVRRRLQLQLVVGLVGCVALGASTSWNVLVLLLGPVGLIGYVNVANFMDGINSISGLHGLVAGAVFAFLGVVQNMPWLVSAGLVIAAAHAAFLPWNASRHARFFLGDVGSYALGGSVAACAIAAVLSGVPVWAVVSVSLLYVWDSGTTIVRRARRGQDITQAHREHVYQLLAVPRGFSHLSVGAMVALFSLVTGALGVVGSGNGRGPLVVAGCVIGQLAMLLAYSTAPRWALARLPKIVTGRPTDPPRDVSNPALTPSAS